jgi:hypothetical protein
MFVPMTTACNRSSERGAALLIVTSVVLILGVLTLLGSSAFKMQNDYDKERITQEKMQKIVNQLAAYAQLHDRIPCPAAPSPGDPSQITFGGEDAAGTNCNRRRGIVPYQTLRMNAYDVVDGWGRYITYGISEVFADITNAANMAFETCRSQSEWGFATYGNVNRNPMKARFCCPPAPAAYPNTTDLDINGLPALTRNTVPGNIGTVNTIIADNTVSNNISSEAYAIVLVSHGRNGFGAYLGNNTMNRLNSASAASYSAAEQDNTSNTITDLTYTVQQMNYIRGTAGPNRYFDDIVIALSQQQLYASLNSATCGNAWH